MKKLVLIYFICVTFLFTQNSSDKYNITLLENEAFISLIPVGWNIISYKNDAYAILQDDLNKDNIDDLVIVVEKEGEKNINLPRKLIIAYGTKSGDYIKSVISEKAIPLKMDGGILGDPFNDFYIKKGSLFLYFEGGTGWKWYKRFQFKHYKDGLRLIGAKFGYYHRGNLPKFANEIDLNLITGDYIGKKLNKNKKIINFKGVSKIEKIFLKDFDNYSNLFEYDFFNKK